uniref:Uncharacterized protein n=1 Tax=Meloidogyne hapla TaxID=6305 RepID=A0A1I8BFU7_MELHA
MPSLLFNLLLINFIAFTNCQNPISLSQVEENQRGAIRPFTTSRPKITTWRSTKSTPRPVIIGRGDKDSRGAIVPRIGPIILPKDSIEIKWPEGERKDGHNVTKYTPAPNRARNCQSLAQYCHHRAYRKILQSSGIAKQHVEGMIVWIREEICKNF